MSDQITEITMPRLSDSMHDGTILSWLKAAGDEVQAGEELLEIETDKATMAYESPAAGLLTIVAQAGETLPVGALIATLGDRAGAAADSAAPAAPESEAPSRRRRTSRAQAAQERPKPRPSLDPRPRDRSPAPTATAQIRQRSAPRRSRAVSPVPTASTSPRCGEPGPAGGSPAQTSPSTPA